MKRDSKRALAAIAIAASAALAAGCAAGIGSTVRVPPVAPSAQSRSAQSPSTTASRTATATGQSPKQRAEADAAAILASFAVPPGAVKLPAAPPVGQGVLKRPVSSPADPDLVDDAAWWQASGVPQSVLAWEKAHLSRQFSWPGSGSGSSGHVFYRYDFFGLPPVTGVLDYRQLMVEAVAAGGGKTDLRVDAQVTWIPARPASEVVPSAVRAVTLSQLPNPNVHTKLPAPVTITDPGKVRALVAFIDGLPEFSPAFYSCPGGEGVSLGLVLTFRARAGGPALAVATVELTGCQHTDFSIGGKAQPELGGLGEGRSEAAKAAKIAGLNWTFPLAPV